MAENLQPDNQEEEEPVSSPLITPSSTPDLFEDSFTTPFSFDEQDENESFDADPRRRGEQYDPQGGDPLDDWSYLQGERKEEEEDPSPSYIADVGRGIVYGGLGFAESLTWLAGSAGNTAIEIAERAGLNERGGFRFGELELNESWTPKTWLGGMVGGITEIAAGYALTAATLGVAAPAGVASTAAGVAKLAAMGGKLNRFSRFYKWLLFSQKTSMTGLKVPTGMPVFGGKTFNLRWGSMRRSMAISTIADFISFKEHEDRVSNLLQDWPIVGNVVTKYLASDKTDNWFEGRMKNAVEGMGIGLVAEMLLPFLRTQRAVRKEIALGNFDKAMDIQKKSAPEFQSMVQELRSGEGVTVLHNEDVLRQYLSLVPDMDPSKMAAAEVMFRTVARVNNFRDLNSFLQQGLRTATLNMPLPGGALEGFVDAKIFSDGGLMRLQGSKNPLGDGTPYALFESSEFRNIKTILEKEDIPYTTHNRTIKNEDGTTKKTKVYVVPGMSIEKAKRISDKSGKESFVTHKGIHQVVDDGTSRTWKIRPLKKDSQTGKANGVKVSESGEYRFKDDRGEEIRYDLNYADELQDTIPSQHGDDLILGQSDITDPGRLPRIQTDYNSKGQPLTPKGRARKLAEFERDDDNLKGVMKGIRGLSFHNPADIAALLGDTPPEYLWPLQKFLNERKARALRGEMTVRDTIKAAVLTVGSQRSNARSWNTPVTGVRPKLIKSLKEGIGTKKEGGGKVRGKSAVGEMKKEYNWFQTQGVANKERPIKFKTFLSWLDDAPEATDSSWDNIGGKRALEDSKQFVGNQLTDKIRPEEYVGLWLTSPNGRVALDALENGFMLPALWEELRHLRGAIGSETLSNTNLLPKVIRDIQMGRAGFTETKGLTKQFNIANLQKVTDAFNNHMTGFDEILDPKTGAKTLVKSKTRVKGDWDTDFIARQVTEISGIGDAKEGFMKHYLGIGDTFTLDSNQLRFWLTGLPATGPGSKGLKGSLEEMHLALVTKANKLMKGKSKAKQEWLSKVEGKMRELLDQMVENGVKGPANPTGAAAPEDLTAHLLHHWLWDNFMGAESKAIASQQAMSLAQRGSMGGTKGAVTFADDGTSTFHLFATSFSDRYGRTYEPSDIGTVIHEIAHLFRRGMQDPIAFRKRKLGENVKGFQAGPSYADDLVKIEKKLGVVDGQWTVAQEEMFAKEFESWIMGGGTVEGLEREFTQMKGWMEELYRNAHNSPLKHAITDEAKSIFGRIFGKEGLPTFLTSKDHMDLTEAFTDAIEDGMSLESSLETVGMNLRLWSNETEAEDVLQGLTRWLGTEDGKKVVAKFKNPEMKPGGGGEMPRGMTYVHPKTGEKIKDVNIQYNSTTLELASNLADSLGTKESLLIRQLGEDAGLASNLPEHLIAGKILVDGYVRSMYQLAQKVAVGEGGEAVASTLKILQQKFSEVHLSVLRIQRGTARTVQAGNIPIRGLDADQVNQIVANSGGVKNIQKFAQDLLEGADHSLGKVSAKQLRMMSKNQLFWDMSHEWRINGLLSSIKSLTVDVASTTIHLALLPFERAWGGFLMGDRELIKEGLGMYYGYATALKESVRIMGKGQGLFSGPVWKAFSQEKQILDPMVRTSETVQNAWSRDRIRQVFPTIGEKSVQGKVGGLLAGFFHYAGAYGVRLPSRFRMVSKELFDQLAYRARFREILLKQALDKFPPIEPLRGGVPKIQSRTPSGKLIVMGDTRDLKSLQKARADNIAKYVVDNFESGFDAMGRGLNKDAMQYAREVNFSEPLHDGIGAVVQNWKYRSPAAGLLVPFVRTPTWLIRGFIGRSFGGLTLLPVVGDMVATLNPALKVMREDFLAGGARQARTLGKVHTGAVLYGTAVVLAYEGAKLPGGSTARIIGSGPPDPAQRKIWEGGEEESGGKIANSVEITDAQGNKRYIGFDRLDPFWMFFGMAADFVQLAEYLTDDQKDDIAAFGMIALTNRLDGAYMKGAMDAAGAWSEGGGKLEHFLANMGKSFIPRMASQNPLHALAQIPGLEDTGVSEFFGSMNDKYRRERESVLTAWQTMLPWLWDKFGVKYDTITGKPIREPDAWLPGAGGGGKETFWGAMRGEVSPFLYSESRAEDNPMAKIAEMLYGFGPPSNKKYGLDLRDIETNYEDDDGIRVRNAYQAWQKEIGNLPVETELNKLTSHGAWDSTAREEQISMVRSTLSNLREMAFGRLLLKNPKLRRQILEARIQKRKELREAVMSKRLSASVQG